MTKIAVFLDATPGILAVSEDLWTPFFSRRFLPNLCTHLPN